MKQENLPKRFVETGKGLQIDNSKVKEDKLTLREALKLLKLDNGRTRR